MKRVELDVSRDPHARSALEAYADACEAERPVLAAQLRGSLARHHDGATLCGPTLLRVFSLARDWAAARPDFSSLAWEHVEASLLSAVAQHFAGPAPEIGSVQTGEFRADEFQADTLRANHGDASR